MDKIKSISFGLVFIMLTGCYSQQPSKIVANSTQTATSLNSTPTILALSETPTITATSETIAACIPAPSIDSFLLQTYYEIDLKKFGINMSNVIEPVLSPDHQYLALSLYEGSSTKGTSHLAILNMKDKNITWLHEYQAFNNWLYMDVAWSPDSQWVVFFPGNMVYAGDSGLWIFDITGKNKYQYTHASSVKGWDETSQKIYFGYKDAFGYVNTKTWEATYGEKCR